MVEEVEGAVAWEEGLRPFEEREAAAAREVERVGCGGNQRVGDGQGEDVAGGQFLAVVEVGAAHGVEADVFLLGSDAFEAGAGHFVEAAAPLGEREALGAARFEALAVVQGEGEAVPVPGVLVHEGGVVYGGEEGALHRVVGAEEGVLFIVVDERAHIVGPEGFFVVLVGAEDEAGFAGLHFAAAEFEVGRPQHAAVGGAGAEGGGSLGLQRYAAREARFAAVHLELGAVEQLRHRHGVAVGVPAEEGVAVVDFGESVFLLHIEGVGLGHHGVGEEEVFVGFGVGGEVFQHAFAAEAAVAEVHLAVEGAAAAVGGIAAFGGFAYEAEAVVGLHLEGFGDVGEDARRGEHAAEGQAVGLEVGELLDDEGVERVVEAVADVGAAEDEGLVVIDKTGFQAVEDGVVLVLLQSAVVVGHVDLDVAHEVVERGAHPLGFVGVGEGGHLEPQRVDLGEVEFELVIDEHGVGDVHVEASHVDVAREGDVAVAFDGDVAPVGFDHHQLAVADYKLLYAVDAQVEGGEVEFGVHSLGVAFESEGVVVVPFLLHDGFVEAHQFVVDVDAVGGLVEGDQSRFGEAVDEQFGLHLVEFHMTGQRREREVALHAVVLHEVEDPHHGAHSVDALHLAVFSLGIEGVGLEGDEGAGVVLGHHAEFYAVFVLKPVDGLAVDVQLVVAVVVGAVVVAFGVVGECHLSVLDQVAHQYARVADGVVAEVEPDGGALGGEHVGREREFGGAHHEEGPALAVENHGGGVLLVVGDEAGAVHHEAALEVHAGHHFFEFEVALVGAELGEAVLVGGEADVQLLLHPPPDGLLEVGGVDKLHRVGREFGELGYRLVLVEVGIADSRRKAAAFPRQAAAFAPPQVVEVVIDSRGAVDGVGVAVGGGAGAVGEFHGRGEEGLYVVGGGLELEGRAGLHLPHRRPRPVDGAGGEQVGGVVDEASQFLGFFGEVGQRPHRLHPLGQEGAAGGLVGHECGGEVEVVRHRGQFGGAERVVHIHHLLAGFGVHGAVDASQGFHGGGVGLQLGLVFGGAVEEGEQLRGELVGGEGGGGLALGCGRLGGHGAAGRQQEHGNQDGKESVHECAVLHLRRPGGPTLESNNAEAGVLLQRVGARVKEVFRQSKKKLYFCAAKLRD